MGQDGHRFNGTVNQAPQNTSVPAAVAEALFNFSDHLPVTLKLSVDKTLDINEHNAQPFMAGVQPNPVRQKANIQFYMPASGLLHAQLFDLHGQVVLRQEQAFAPGRQMLDMDMSLLQPGFYVLNLTDGNGRVENLKIIKESAAF